MPPVSRSLAAVLSDRCRLERVCLGRPGDGVPRQGPEHHREVAATVLRSKPAATLEWQANVRVAEVDPE